MKRKIMILILFILLSTMTFASNSNNTYEKFYNKWKPLVDDCGNSTICQYNYNKETNMFTERTQSRFLFFNVSLEYKYELDDSGNIIEAEPNFWQRMANKFPRLFN